jgi:hypothetical protein
MSEKGALKGLNCPRCGGMVPIPEGQDIVVCPFCDMRSVVRGESGVRRYQVPQRVDREQAEKAFRGFLGNWAIARSVPREAKITEALMVHLPFWATWGRVLAYVFGVEVHRNDKNTERIPKEIKVLQDMTSNGAACDVGEFGVTQINLEGRPLEPYSSEELHRSGMVFEPTNSSVEALEQSRAFFESQVRQKASLDEVSQSFVRIIHPRQGLVFYPLWVIRYTYRGRVFQVVVDGFSGEMLYGKAPGNVFYRAAALVGGMAAGSFVGIDVAYLLAAPSGNDSNSSGEAALVAFGAGLVIMFLAFRTYRYGEHYEYRRKFPGMSGAGMFNMQLPSSAKGVLDVVRSLEKMR